MKKTEKMINEFLEQVEKDRVLAVEKLTELKKERNEVNVERSEISKAILRFEHEGDLESAKKLTAELTTRVNKIGVLDSKIEAYDEMGNVYESEAEKVFACAAQELNEDYQKSLAQANDNLLKARNAVKEAEALVTKLKAELEVANFNKDSLVRHKQYIVTDRLKEILKYLPPKIKNNDPNIENIVAEKNGCATTFRKEYTEYYGEGIEAQLNYYYQKGVSEAQKETTKKKSLVDRILGR